MYRIIISVITITLLLGCAQKNTPQKEANTEKSAVAQIVQDRIPAAKPVEVQPLIVTPPSAQKSMESIKADELMIDQGKWCYSIYDPEMGEIEYFTGSGSLLGSRRTIFLPGSDGK